MFELKKMIASLLMPLPAMLIIGFAGLMLIMFTTQRKCGCYAVLVALLGILLMSFQPISSRLLMPLERQYSAFLPIDGSVDYVMVLGNAHVVDNDIPPTSELSTTSLVRLSEGIRILRMYPGAKLLLSGYAGGSSTSNARMMAKVALALGVAKSDIILLENAHNTHEEAQQAAAFVEQRKLVVVTSASHMKRAMNEFHAAGLSPIAAPTNFLAQAQIHQAWDKYTPKATYLNQTELYWHETLGRIWQFFQQSSSDEESANHANHNPSTPMQESH